LAYTGESAMNPWWYVLRLIGNVLKALGESQDSPDSPSESSQTESKDQANNQKKLVICPVCCRRGELDDKCEHCGYDMKLDRTEIEQYFINPVLYAPKRLYDENNLIPNKPGVYGWYFCDLFENELFDDESKTNFIRDAIKIEVPQIPNEDYLLVYRLMYIGIAKDETLRNRIYKKHLKANSENSTLRKSLAALLYDKIGLDPQKQLNGEVEKNKLNSWIFENAKVAWITLDNPKSVETKFIEQHGKILPLNLQENEEYNPCYKNLSAKRQKWRSLGW
jgi:hypothetical protein